MKGKNNPSTLLLTGMTLAALYLCYLLLRPYITAVLFASVIAIVFQPLHRHVKKHIHNRTAGALVSTLVTLLITIIPLTCLLLAISNELRELYQRMAAKNGAAGVTTYLLASSERLVTWVSRVLHVPAVDLREIVLSRLENASSSLLSMGTAAVSNIFSFLAKTVIAIAVLFFLFRDGDAAISKCMAFLPMDDKRLSELRARIMATVNTNVYGGVAVGAIQGTLTGLSFWMVGIDSPVLWGAVTGVFSLVPIFGSAIVWFPASVALLLSGHIAKGIVLLALGAALISTIDNVVRPLIIHKNLHLHPILVLFALLGGVRLWGALGLFVGPVILSVTIALLVMLQEDLSATKSISPETPEPRASSAHSE